MTSSMVVSIVFTSLARANVQVSYRRLRAALALYNHLKLFVPLCGLKSFQGKYKVTKRCVLYER